MTDLSAKKAQLEARLAELESRLHKIDSDLDAPVSKNWDEAAIERENDEVREEIGHEGLKEVRAIRAALTRIEDGTYGECIDCGEEISPERLEAVPYAALCRKCAA
ncbi:TraR/DksA family transcriptional regulator [Parvularcula marina]|uniref:TraR/DksA family transcriptional regulator n=1 Tax=Parvularcula marina TaxID=2292771 RepID=UPI003510FFBD